MDLKVAALQKEQLDLYRSFILENALDHIQDEDVLVIGALDGDALVGVMVVKQDDPVRVMSISVNEDYQRKGVGSTLMDELAGRLIEAGAEGMEALLFGTDEEDYKGLSQFLWRCGFIQDESYLDVEVSLGEVAANKEFARVTGEKTNHNTRLLSELTEMEKKKLGKILSVQAGYHNFPRQGLLEKLSCVYEDKGEICGCVLMGEKGNTLELQYVFLNADLSDRIALFRMMSRTLEASRSAYGDDKKLRILTMNEKSEKIADYFFSASQSRDRLNRFYFDFSNPSEEVEEEPEDAYRDPGMVGISGDLTEGLPQTSMAQNPVFHILSNADLTCRDCVYRITGMGADICHKFDSKPGEVLGGGSCPKYRKEGEV
ncbi:MAG: GNAT family N-acetyltransferase [Lachnospiraceae bacterium]|nr:GNAT family N-acetyltransferase [Lachnospiraceae bacterium]